MHHQTFKTTMSEGEGEGKHFCDADCVSILGKKEISKGCGLSQLVLSRVVATFKN